MPVTERPSMPTEELRQHMRAALDKIEGELGNGKETTLKDVRWVQFWMIQSQIAVADQLLEVRAELSDFVELKPSLRLYQRLIKRAEQAVVLLILAGVGYAVIQALEHGFQIP